MDIIFTVMIWFMFCAMVMTKILVVLCKSFSYMQVYFPSLFCLWWNLPTFLLYELDFCLGRKLNLAFFAAGLDDFCIILETWKGPSLVVIVLGLEMPLYTLKFSSCVVPRCWDHFCFAWFDKFQLTHQHMHTHVHEIYWVKVN